MFRTCPNTASGSRAKRRWTQKAFLLHIKEEIIFSESFGIFRNFSSILSSLLSQKKNTITCLSKKKSKKNTIILLKKHSSLKILEKKTKNYPQSKKKSLDFSRKIATWHFFHLKKKISASHSRDQNKIKSQLHFFLWK